MAISGNQPDTVLNRILTWSQARPNWQRDALRRIIVNGFPDETELSEILALCKKENGDSTVELVATPLAESHLPSDPGAGASVSLKSISEVAGVNQLADGQALTLETNGITIVYGPNGTGKSGYTRILKKACRSRHAGDIMPDVYNPPPSGFATAKLTIVQTTDGESEITWVNDGSSPEALSAITVFDRDAASVHIQKKNEVWFRPFGLDIPDDLAGVCQKLKEQLTAEKQTLENQRNAVFDSPIWSSRSSIGNFLSSLKHDTELATTSLKKKFDQDDEARLMQLQADAAQDPAVAAQKQRDYATQLDQLSAYLSKVEAALNNDQLKRIRDLKHHADEARTAADTAASAAFSDLSIKGVGEAVWKSLWESARAFSEILENTEVSFPPRENETCVLCHQKIDQPTASRMLAFEEFIKNDTEAKAASAEQKFTNAISEFERLNVHVSHVSSQWKNLKSGNPALAREVLSFIARSRVRHQHILRELKNLEVLKVLDLPVPLTGKLDGAANNTRTYASTLEDDAAGGARERLLDELAELKDQKQFEELMEIARKEVSRLAKLELTEKCIRDVTTTAITRLGNDIADDLISPRMRDRFQQEIGELAGNRVRVEVVRSGGRFGSPQYEVKLFANPKAKVHDVLSEGEQTCVALASYLTELANASHSSALVFDDPVSSLDHRWRTNVAKRIAKEAGVRQVIVFTHDMIFVNDLHQVALSRNIPVSLSHLSRDANSVGIVNADLPWRASGVRDRIDKLEKSAREAKKLHDENKDEDYSQKVAKIYNDLRATWERALEDIVFANVIMRHRDYVNPRNLKQVTALEESDVETFQENFQKCHDYVDAHDPSRGHDIVPPDPNEVKTDIDTLKSWSEALRSKMNAVS